VPNVLGMTKYSLEDFVHNCIRVKGLGENIREEKLYLKYFVASI